MSSSQIKSVVSYDYYDERFHFCRPSSGPEKQAESLGSILFGDRIFNSAFNLNMKNDVSCQLLCHTDPIPKEDAEFINQCIADEYALNLMVDGLPAARDMKFDEHSTQTYKSIGVPLGDHNANVLNNHYEITIRYHVRPNGKNRVVGVNVDTYSKDIELDAKGVPQCGAAANRPGYTLKADGKDRVIYTYSVIWEESNTAWATRWDEYLSVLDPSIHWFSLVNSIVIVLFLTGMVAMILIRALHKDISRYNAAEVQEDVQEDYGWKLVHGDVFRPPVRSMWLAVIVGSGTQLIAICASTLAFAVLGFLSPSNRGALATVMVILFMIFSGIAGYVSARLYKMNGGESWKTNMLLTAVFFPGTIFGALFALNFFLIGSQSSGAVPFGTMVALFGMWGLIALPLSVAGSYLGFRKAKIEHPVRTNQIPRQIPDQPSYLKSWPSILMGGTLPFGAIFIELYFIMNSIWFHRIYYGIGFLFLVFVVLVLTCSQVTILMCYFHLCNEDYHWSWRAFMTSGAAGIYVFLYSIYYYFNKLAITSFTSSILYFGYSSIIGALLMVMTGSIGYLSCLIFLQRIFASIKVD
ncbi:hypothetical protein BC940DRAFT_246682 [Gongronella butleri]|nr:hypothetical protein BC940DRAFT_246682 [Gongronella butleri]